VKKGLKELKIKLRNSILQLRNSIGTQEVIDKSNIIIGKLVNLKQFNSSRTIMCYVDFRNEVITRDLIKLCLAQDKKVAIPAIVDKSEGGKQMAAFEIKEIENSLIKGTYGIQEPLISKRVEIEPEVIDLLIVPGVVFDKQKNRIGYGAGFYDKFLNKVRIDCFKIGIAFEHQVIEMIPTEVHDIPMDIVITESNVF
jgi:5-formyltetrahydrofolate cyclo-ligase